MGNDELRGLKIGVGRDGILGRSEARGSRPAFERPLELNSVATLRDLGMSGESIVAYLHRFPTPAAYALGR
jgi:hypothetical protein